MWHGVGGACKCVCVRRWEKENNSATQLHVSLTCHTALILRRLAAEPEVDVVVKSFAVFDGLCEEDDV